MSSKKLANRNMEYVTLTKWEWQILCAQGSIRMLVVRICEIAEGQSTTFDAQKLFALAPQFNLADAHAFVIAELLPEWRKADSSSGVGLSESLKSLSLEAVKCFFPITTAEVEGLQEKAVAGGILLGGPKFELLWRNWVGHQTQVLTRRSAEKFVAVLGLEEWMPDVSIALNRCTVSEIGTSVLDDDLIGIFLDNVKKILKQDEARSEEGTCAHAISCVTVWASLFSNRPIPLDGSDLQAKLVARLERYRERKYGDTDYLTLGLHHEFQALVEEAPGAFDKLLTPISVGIYLRFAVAIQFGPPLQPRDLVAAILRLQDFDGGLAAAICAYLIGLKLKPQLVHQIVMGLEGDKFPVVDRALTEKTLGLVSICSLRKFIAAPTVDFDAGGNDVAMPENTSELHDPIEVGLVVEIPAADPEAKA